MTTYTPREASRLLDVPQSTIRRWAARFGHYLSAGAQRGKRIYDDSDLGVFAQVRDLTRQNKTLDQIDKMLGEVITQPGAQQRALSLPGVLREINGIHETLTDHDAQLAALRERLDRLEKRSFWDRLFGRK